MVIPSVLAKLVLCETLKTKAELAMKIVHFADFKKSIKHELALHRKPRKIEWEEENIFARKFSETKEMS